MTRRTLRPDAAARLRELLDAREPCDVEARVRELFAGRPERRAPGASRGPAARAGFSWPLRAASDFEGGR